MYYLHIFRIFNISIQHPLCYVLQTKHTLFFVISAGRQQPPWYPLQLAKSVCHQIPHGMVFGPDGDWARLTGLSCNKQTVHCCQEMQGRSWLTPVSQTITSHCSFWLGLLSSEGCMGLYVGEKERMYRKSWRISLLFLEGSTAKLWSFPRRNRSWFSTGSLNMFQLKIHEEWLLWRTTK